MTAYYDLLLPEWLKPLVDSSAGLENREHRITETHTHKNAPYMEALQKFLAVFRMRKTKSSENNISALLNAKSRNSNRLPVDCLRQLDLFEEKIDIKAVPNLPTMTRKSVFELPKAFRTKRTQY